MMTKMSFMLVLFSLILTASAAGLKLTPGTYKIDQDHTRVSFLINHLVVSQVEGRFDHVDGSFVLQPKIAESSIDVKIPVDSLNTGVAKRDEDLKSPNFFEVAKYPDMTFKSKKFSGKLEDFKVVGDLTIKDVTKEVTLAGKYTGSVKDPWGNERAAVQASGKIKRKDFHINYNDMIDIGPAVGEEVTIHIISEGILQAAKK